MLKHRERITLVEKDEMVSQVENLHIPLLIFFKYFPKFKNTRISGCGYILLKNKKQHNFKSNSEIQGSSERGCFQTYSS